MLENSPRVIDVIMKRLDKIETWLDIVKQRDLPYYKGDSPWRSPPNFRLQPKCDVFINRAIHDKTVDEGLYPECGP